MRERKILKNHLKNVLKIISSPGGKEKNLNLKNLISLIEYSPTEIKITLNNSAYLDSSADLSTITADRRPSLAESRIVNKYPAEAPYNNAKSAKGQGVDIKNKPISDFSKTGSCCLVGSSGKTRTYNLVINSHPLCRLSYRGT